MDAFLMGCRFVGAWLLVAGPVYQAALELEAEDLEFVRIHRIMKEVAPPPISPLWWLLPPVKLILGRISFYKYRRLLVARLSKADLTALWRFSNKATGWLLVAGGGLLLAISQSRELSDRFRWSHGAFAGVCGLMVAVCLANALYRLAVTRRFLAMKNEPAAVAALIQDGQG